MDIAEPGRQRSARTKIAAQQAAARRAEVRKRSLIAGGAVVAVLAVVVGLVVAKSLQHAPAPRAIAAKADAGLIRQITSVPPSVFDAVAGGPTGPTAVSPMTAIPGAAALTEGGKPEMLYVGAEYCPYCAAERWAMVVALSRFGTFSGLRFIHSSSTDVYANTSTVTFYRSRYVSKYLTFTPVEWYTVSQATLQPPTKAQLALLTKYGHGSFPFVDLANRYVVSGSQYLPSVLGTSAQPGSSQAGLTWAQIAGDLTNPKSPVAQSVLGAANRITAAICKVTNGQPGSVCASPGVTAVNGSI